MRKLLILSLISVFTVSMLLFGVSCKEEAGAPEEEAPEEEVVAEEVAEEEAPEEEVVEETETSEPVHIRMVSWATETAYEPLIAFLTEKAKENNIDFEYQFVDNQQLDNVLNTQLAAGEGPDIIHVGASFRGQVNAGYLLDLSDQPFIDLYSDTFLNHFQIEGGIYAIPTEAYFGGIYYNKKIFKEYNINTPATWDEFMDIGEELEGTDIAPFIVGAKTYGIPSWNMFGLLNNAFYSDLKNLAFDDAFAKGEAKAVDNWLEPLEKYWSQMLAEGYLTPNMVGLEDEQALNEFALGNVATFSGGNWHKEIIYEKNPDIELAMFPYPAVEAGKTGWMVGAAGNGFAINVDSENIDAALALFAELSTPEGQMAMVANNVAPVGLKGVTIDISEEFDECTEAFDAGNIHAPWPKWSYAGPLIESLTKEIQLYIAGSKTMEEWLTDFDAKNLEILETGE